MKKLAVVLLILLAAATLIVGCRGESAESAGEAALIGIAMPETHVQRWVKDGNSLKAEAEELGYRAEVQWGNADQAQQNQQIQSFLTQGAKVMVVGCINDGVTSVIGEAGRDNVRSMS